MEGQQLGTMTATSRFPACSYFFLPEHQHLCYMGEKLDKNETLISYNISEGSVLISGINISVKTLTGKIVTLDTNLSTTALWLKKILENMEGIPIGMEISIPLLSVICLTITVTFCRPAEASIQ